MKTIIHVNKHVIAANRKHGRNDPPLTVKTYRENRRCQEAKILCDRCGCEVAVFRHSPQKPLKCGARVWVETEAEVLTR